MEHQPDFSSPDSTPHQELNFVDLRDVISSDTFKEHIRNTLYKITTYPTERETIINDFIDDISDDNEFIGDIFDSKIDYAGFDYSDVDEDGEPELCSIKGASLQNITIRDIYQSPAVVFRLRTQDEEGEDMIVDAIPTESDVAQFVIYSKEEHSSADVVEELREAAREAQQHLTSPEFLALSEREQDLTLQSISCYFAEILQDVYSPVMTVRSMGYYHSMSPFLQKNLAQSDYRADNNYNTYTRGELVMVTVPESRTYSHTAFRSETDFPVNAGMPCLLFEHKVGDSYDYRWIPIDEIEGIEPNKP